ncbi:M50 family metallopeptidase [Salimicrobium album]|uniref:Peptidase M50B-like n=1 Tax=Salimicrobium album TaxID=50717 RepID=A0A1H3J0I3_9BACI|nr:M50 family metallopeptidase [Salimicrobium album]SDY33470.1 Peptidase M50B-like [Salimicrobium album]
MKTQIIISLIVALLLTQMPIIGKYFAMLNTMVHETGHSLMALLSGGEVRNISLFPNTSGVTMTGHTSWFSHVLTSLSGYIFASTFAFLLFYLLSRGKYTLIVILLLGLLSVNLLFWVRNPYGVFWIITFAALFVWLLRSGHQTLIVYALTFIAALILVQSVISAFNIMWLSLTSPSGAGDATNLARATKIPAVVWGTGFFLQAFYFGIQAWKRFF